MSSGFGSGMIGTYVSMADIYTGARSGAGDGFCAGDLLAAVRAVVDVHDGAIFAVVDGTVRIFCVG